MTLHSMYIPCTFHVPHYLRQLVPRLTPHGSTANMKKLGSQAFVTRQQVYRKMGHDGINMPDWFQVVFQSQEGCNTAQNLTNRTNWVSIGYDYEPCTILTCISSMSWFCDNLAISSWLQVERARCQGINRHTRKHIWNNRTYSVLEL